jgi:hypothetical protein
VSAVAKTEGEILGFRVERREQPDGVAVGSEKPNHRFEVDGSVFVYEGSASGTAVLEEFLALGVDLEPEQFGHRAAQTCSLLELHYQRALTVGGQFLVM